MRNAGMNDWPIGGLVVTGGGAEMTGLPSLAARIVGEPVRVGYPYGIYGLPDLLRKPKYSAAVGLLLWGIKHHDSAQRLNGEPKQTKTRRWVPRFRPIVRKKKQVETG
jgi:cell division protein FtsA